MMTHRALVKMQVKLSNWIDSSDENGPDETKKPFHKG